MPAETKTIEKKQRLLSLLREMFQLDQPDLDFGLYRIMHAKRGQLEAFKEQHTQLMAAFRDSEKADKAVSRTKKD